MIVVLEGEAYELRRGMRPRRAVLQQNAPNPFNAATVIPFQVPRNVVAGGVRIAIYDLLGQIIRVLEAPSATTGGNALTWDGRDAFSREAATGVYVYRLVGHPGSGRRMLLLRSCASPPAPDGSCWRRVVIPSRACGRKRQMHAVENEIARRGEQRALLDDMLRFEIDYRLVTPLTALFAPEPGIQVNPRNGDGDRIATAVVDRSEMRHWLDKSFALRDGVWIDTEYRTSMSLTAYPGKSEPDPRLDEFAPAGS